MPLPGEGNLHIKLGSTKFWVQTGQGIKSWSISVIFELCLGTGVGSKCDLSYLMHYLQFQRPDKMQLFFFFSYWASEQEENISLSISEVEDYLSWTYWISNIGPIQMHLVLEWQISQDRFLNLQYSYLSSSSSKPNNEIHRQPLLRIHDSGDQPNY